MNKTTTKYFWYGLAAVLLYFLPAVIMGENTFVATHDFLDSTMAHIKSMKDSGTLWDYNATMPIMCGLPRFIYEPSCNLKIWIYAICSPFWGVLLNYLLVRLTAFVGMFLLLARYVIPESSKKPAACLIGALLFALLPYYVDYGLSSAGIPLLAFAFLNLHHKREILPAFLIFAYYAVNNSIMLGAFFACAMTAIIICIYFFSTKKFPWLPFAGLCFLSVAAVAANWNMISGFFTCVEPMSRAEYIKSFDIVDLLDALSALVIGQYHASCFLAFVIVPLFVVTWKKFRGEDKILDWVMQAFVLLAGTIVVTDVAKRALNGVTIFREFQIDRFFFLYPCVCFVMFALVAYEWLKHDRRKPLVWFSALVLLGNFAFDINFRENVGRIAGISDSPSFKQFYDVPLIGEIKDSLDIRDWETKCACVGMYQSVLEYNDIYTVDGYIQMYPVHYKYDFEKVIRGELDKSPVLEDYFCNWGSRCYIFSAELGQRYEWGKNSGKTIRQLDIDTQALADLGCEYLFAGVPVENWQELGLEWCGEFSHDDSFWKINVYRVCR